MFSHISRKRPLPPGFVLAVLTLSKFKSIDSYTVNTFEVLSQNMSKKCARKSETSAVDQNDPLLMRKFRLWGQKSPKLDSNNIYRWFIWMVKTPICAFSAAKAVFAENIVLGNWAYCDNLTARWRLKTRSTSFSLHLAIFHNEYNVILHKKYFFASFK